MKGILKYLLAGGVALAAFGCGGGDGSGDNSGDSPAAIEAAHLKGREAARVFVNTTWKDTVQLQRQLLEANAKRSEFDGQEKAVAAFDSAFISTVRTVRPDVAAELERMRPR